MTTRVLLLTTETPHHVFFAKRLVELGHNVEAVLEHPLGESRQTSLGASQQGFEQQRWFSSDVPRFEEVLPVQTVSSVSDLVGSTHLRRKWEVAISFGTQIIPSNVLDELPRYRWNLHGGDPQRYRGLDSHLWALYHGDYSGLVTTLHVLDRQVDCGPIVLASALNILGISELHMLRAINTEMAVSLADGALQILGRTGCVPELPQFQVGRYYSSFPAELLPIAERRFRSALQGQTPSD